MFLAVSMFLLVAACDKPQSAPPAPPPGPFDGLAALRYAKTQVDFGPRVPGSEAHRKAGDWIVEQMRLRADTVYEQRWNHRTANGTMLPMRNIVARYRPGAAERVLYVTHWDSRPRSDKGSTDEERKLPVPGANDGASGVGLFIALGDLLKKTPPSMGVDLVFVDGEDYGEFGPPDVDVLVGSTYFADHLPSPDYRPVFGVVFDMIGDAQLNIEQEGHSLANAKEVVERVWSTAASLGHGRYFLETNRFGETTDDHVPLQKKGLKVIDVIDLDYAYHHTAEDTIDKISSQSLKVVGDVAYALVK